MGGGDGGEEFKRVLGRWLGDWDPEPLDPGEAGPTWGKAGVVLEGDIREGSVGEVGAAPPEEWFRLGFRAMGEME